MWRSRHVIELCSKRGRVCGKAASREKPRINMYYVYVLENNSGRMYIGSSADPDSRLISHNAGRVRSTKGGRPWRRILLEEYEDKSFALKRERYLKSGWGRKELKKN
jgi:putative endonuclease